MPDLSPPPQDVAATFCATLVDEWARGGVRRALIAPGSRSTPMALAAATSGQVEVSVHHDERSAAFAALGVGLASGRPAIVLTTSGTAAVELHPAVVEAHHAQVPMLVVTADRPPERREVGSPQTIDQLHLFGRSVRWFFDPGVAEWSTRDTWRSIAAQALRLAVGPRPGPVHLNLPFREPLVGSALRPPVGRRGGGPWHGTAGRELAIRPISVRRSARGLVVAGRGAGAERAAIAALGWPVLADPRAGVGGVAHADPILRHSTFAQRHRPEAVVRIGEPPASRVVAEWLDGLAAPQLVVSDRWIDPSRRADDLGTTLEVVEDGPPPRGWRAAWQRADAAADRAIATALEASRSLSEPAVARLAVTGPPAGTVLVAASSMPVRDVEWFAPRRPEVDVIANRGANGIDGVVSTAVGVALTGRRTVALVGDLAFLHDASALVALGRRRLDLTIVVVDNDGGGIFSFLPQAAQLSPGRFEQLLGTPHGTDCVAVARAFGLPARPASTVTGLRRALVAGRGTRVVVVRTDRQANLEVHRELNERVREALHRVR